MIIDNSYEHIFMKKIEGKYIIDHMIVILKHLMANSYLLEAKSFDELLEFKKELPLLFCEVS